MFALVIAQPPATPDEVFARYEAYMAKADELSLKITARSAEQPGEGVGSLEWRKPERQRYRMKWGESDFEWRQAPGESMIYEHGAKLYEGEWRVGGLAAPPDKIAAPGLSAYPQLLLTSRPGAFLASSPWSWQQREPVAGTLADRLYVQVQTERGPVDQYLWFDSEGRLLRYRFGMAATPNLYNEIELTEYKLSAPPNETFAVSLPWGYVPLTLPSAQQQLYNGQPFRFGKWTDARTDRAGDVAALAKSRFVAVLFTQADDPIAKDAEPTWRSLRKALTDKGAELIEVVLGEEKPDLAGKESGRKVYWDRDGSIAKQTTVDATPYVMLIHPREFIIRAFIGYREEDAPLLESTILSGLTVKVEDIPPGLREEALRGSGE